MTRYLKFPALALLPLFALSSPAHGDVIYPFSPGVAASIHDQPIDGLGDSVDTGSAHGLISRTALAEDRAIHEYTTTGLLVPVIDGAWFTGRIDAQDQTDVGVRSFAFYLYAADGNAAASDFEAPGVLVGTAQYHPPTDMSLSYNLDVLTPVKQMLLSGQTVIGLRVEALSNPSSGDLLSANFGELLIQECGGFGGEYCFGDGTGATCPCNAFGGPGEGCQNSAGLGATMWSSGFASFSTDTLSFHIQGVSGAKPGLMLRGNNQVAIPAGDGILCAVGGSQRSHVQITDATGATVFSDFNGAPFGSVANTGVATNFQYWYRDPMGTCSGQGFNFSNAFSVVYTP